MKTSLSYRLTVVLLVVATSLFAQKQEYSFKVLATKGDNEIKRTDEWEHLKTGSTLYKGERLKLGGTAYVGLMHRSGHALEVREVGEFSVEDLEARVSEGSNIVARYADYLLEMKEEHKSTGTVSGGVHRGGSEGQVHVYATNNNKVLDGKITVHWEPADDTDEYVVIIRNLYEEVIKEDVADMPEYTVDMNDDTFKELDNILLFVQYSNSEGSLSNRVLLARYPARKQNQILEELDDFRGGIDTETALGSYLLSGFYEKNGLILNAYESLKKAMELSGDDAFNEDFEIFLERYRIKPNKK